MNEKEFPLQTIEECQALLDNLNVRARAIPLEGAQQGVVARDQYASFRRLGKEHPTLIRVLVFNKERTYATIFVAEPIKSRSSDVKPL